jgi:hypothetical protein
LARAKRAINEIDVKDFNAGYSPPEKKNRKKRAPVAPEQLEKGITKAIRCILDTVGIRHWKEWGGPMSENGIPDLVCIKKVRVADLVAQGVQEVGLFVGIEVKRPSVKDLRPAQEKWKRRIEASAGIFITARSVDDVIDGLKIRDRFLF